MVTLEPIGEPFDLKVTVVVPWELLDDIKAATAAYGADPYGELHMASARRLILDAIAHELKWRGYYGSGADRWYGSPIERLRRKGK